MLLTPRVVAPCLAHLRKIHIVAIFEPLGRTSRSLDGNRSSRHRRPDPRAARGLQARFDRIFSIRTGYGDLDKLLLRLGRRKAELLRVLERPETPLHTNASERDLRGLVIKRKISGGTVSRNGRQARDSMLGLMKTCQKLGLSFWHYLGDRLGIGDEDHLVAPLASMVAARA
uniref:IS66 family transposase n=1 Tax=Rhizobium ruizarguesonis TaxID=2081791 RepID=UPI00296238CC|nr:transposase [Rhizobium ruizarguesonis]